MNQIVPIFYTLTLLKSSPVGKYTQKDKSKKKEQPEPSHDVNENAKSCHLIGKAANE